MESTPTPTREQSWKFTARWHNGKSSLTGHVIGRPESMDLDSRDRHGVRLYDDVVRMLGYEPMDFGLVWERLDDE